MNEVLEAMARAIFKSWFVDFDPVRAKMDGRKPEGMDAATAKLFSDGFEESELGPIPRGWQIGSDRIWCTKSTMAAKTKRMSTPVKWWPDKVYVDNGVYMGSQPESFVVETENFVSVGRACPNHTGGSQRA